MTKFLNISKDTTLGNTTPSDNIVSSQKAIKTYIDNAVPSQSGNSGKFLSTNGLSTSWETIDANVQYVEASSEPVIVDLSEISVDNQGSVYSFYYDSMAEMIRNDNNEIGDSYAYGVIAIELDEISDVTISLYQNSEEGYDFGELSDADSSLTQDATEDSNNVAWSGKSYGEISDSVTFYNLSAGSHTFTLKYIKDSSGDEGSDIFGITGISVAGGITRNFVDTSTGNDITLSQVGDMPQVLEEIRDSIPDVSNFVTLNTTQKIQAAKAIFGTDVAFGTDASQKNLLAVISDNNSTAGTWVGRLTVGAKNKTFIMGTYGTICVLGAHAWTNAQQGTGAAWEDVYINPDGNKAVYIGGSPINGKQCILKIQNVNANTTGTVQINRSSNLTNNFKDVACWGDNVSKFNNDAGYITGITSSMVTTALGYTPQEELTSGTNIKTINSTSLLGSGDITIDGLPSQSGNSGKFLTTNGTTASWVDAPEEIPSQSGQSGKVLTTNGTVVSWTSFPTVDQTYSGTSTNAQSGTAVKEAIDAAISSTYKAAGSVAFANLPTLGSTYEGNVYNVSDAFTTTADFVEGAGKSYPAGTNVVCIDVGSSTYKWDVLAGFVDLSGYQTLIDSTHKLSADLVDDTSTTNKFVTTTDITNWNGKVDANTAITGATKCKITYDSKGLVTSGSDLTASDIPSITLSKISDVTATAAEVNVLDGITATTTELNYVDGVTSSIQDQLDNKVEYAMVITDYTA